VSKSDLVRSAGYVSTKKDGSERLNFTAFDEALLEAKGVSFGDGGGSGVRKAGRKLSYTTRVQFNGNLMVGKAFTAQLGLEPGDEFEIKLGRMQIELIPPAPVRVLKAAGETDQVIGNTTSSANVSVGLHTCLSSEGNGWLYG
jgi:hypothetical protein